MKNTLSTTLKNALNLTVAVLKACQEEFNKRPLKLNIDEKDFIQKVAHAIDGSLTNKDNAVVNMSELLNELGTNLKILEQILSTDFKINGLDKFADSIKLEPLLDALDRLNRVMSNSIDNDSSAVLKNLWSEINRLVSEYADENGRITNTSKKNKQALSDIVNLYKEYYNLGGKHTLSEISDNKTTYNNLKKYYDNIKEVTYAENATASQLNMDFSNLYRSIDGMESKFKSSSNNSVIYINNIINTIEELQKRINNIDNLKIPQIEIMQSVRSNPESKNIPTNISSTEPQKKSKYTKNQKIIDESTTMTEEEMKKRSEAVIEEQQKLLIDLEELGLQVREITEFYNSKGYIIKEQIKAANKDGFQSVYTAEYDKTGKYAFSSHINSKNFDVLRKRKEKQQKEREKRDNKELASFVNDCEKQYNKQINDEKNYQNTLSKLRAKAEQEEKKYYENIQKNRNNYENWWNKALTEQRISERSEQEKKRKKQSEQAKKDNKSFEKKADRDTEKEYLAREKEYITERNKLLAKAKREEKEYYSKVQLEQAKLLEDNIQAYKSIFDIKRKIAGLEDSVANKDTIKYLKQELSLYGEKYRTTKKQIEETNNQFLIQQQDKKRLEIRDVQENRVGISESKLKSRLYTTRDRLVNSYSQQLNTINASIGKAEKVPQVLIDALNRVSVLLDQLNSQEIIGDKPVKKAKKDIESITREIDDLFVSMKKDDSMRVINSKDVSNLKNKMSIWATSNSSAMKEFGDEFSLLYQRLEKVDNQFELNKIKSEFDELQIKARDAGLIGLSFFDKWKIRMKNIAVYFSSFASIYDIINMTRNGLQSITELDTAMTELRKVSNAPDSALNNYFSTAADSAKQLGSTITDMISATADWSRLG